MATRSALRLPSGRILLATSLAALLSACHATHPVAAAPASETNVSCEGCTAQARASADWRQRALDAAETAERLGDAASAPAHWLDCATSAYRSIASALPSAGRSEADLASRCTEEFLEAALRHSDGPWPAGRVRVGESDVFVEFRNTSPYFRPPVRLSLARNVPMDRMGGRRYATLGFGVALAAVSPRCEDAPVCSHLPPEGVFRPMTAWFEAAGDRPGEPPHLVISGSRVDSSIRIGTTDLELASDTSAAYAQGAATSSLASRAILDLLGGAALEPSEGVFLLDDYDPRKRPVVMLHGLGSSPLAWARLSNAIWGDPELRARYQVWHVVYATDAPLLVTRRRIQRYLDAAWDAVDPERDDPARSHVVVVGHSLGGVVARLLCVESGDTLWNAAFLAPPESLRGTEDDRLGIEEIFRFSPYPGIRRAVFIASPHRGSPVTDRWFGRLVRALSGERAPELQALRRVARDNPEAVREELRRIYQQGRLNSLSTLQPSQPVSRAGQSLMPGADIPYHTIAGELAGTDPASDGIVPLTSAILPGAASTLIVPSNHSVEENDLAVAEVIRILREDFADQPPGP